jgi:mRNA-degrading endonuclease toxin of MazEF toxin-antitoxin module
MADQLTTVAKKRLRDRIGVVEPVDMNAIARIIRLQLDLD